MKPFFPLCTAAAIAAASFVAPACAADMPLRSDAAAVAVLKPANGFEVTGTIQFIPTTRGVRIIARVEHLTPGDHGFHVHEKGDLSAADLASAGGHYNPTHEPHAAPDAARRHVGDLGNLHADAQGVATLDRVDPRLKLDGPESIIERAVIVHADADDFRSQPAGNSGKRVAGGIVLRIER